jgi:hypothetical protein
MNTKHCLLFFFCLLLAATVAASRLVAQAASPTASEGETLERQMWGDMKAKNWPAVEARIAQAFQSVHPDGVRDRTGEIALIKGLKLGEYMLKDFKVTQNGDDLIVTYWISVQETIDAKGLSTKPAMRLSIWKRTRAGWQWIAHANLNPL